MDPIIEEIVNNFINGNISHVRKALGSMMALEAANVAVQVYTNLPDDERPHFVRYLANWA